MYFLDNWLTDLDVSHMNPKQIKVVGHLHNIFEKISSGLFHSFVKAYGRRTGLAGHASHKSNQIKGFICKAHR